MATTTDPKEPVKGTEGTPAPKDPPADPPKPKDGEMPEPKDEAAERIKALNKENEKHRKAAKEANEQLERYKKAMEIINGKQDTPDPVALEKQKADKRVRDAFLKSAFVSEAAKEMHDADFAFSALASSFSDVTVDLDTGTVDRAAIKSKLADLKKEKPFLFVQAQTGGGTPAPAPKGQPDGNGIPAGNNPYKQWLDLKGQPGREAEAQDFFNKNRAAIYAAMPR